MGCMRRTQVSPLLGLIVGLLVVMMPAPAQAAYSECSGSPRMCFWHNTGGGGTHFFVNHNDNHFGSHSDEAHSLWNRSGFAVLVFDDQDWDQSDRYFCVPPGYAHNDLSNIQFGDKITSNIIRTNSSCGTHPTIGGYFKGY